jgi:uncharacterized protein (TIGR02145 family)
MTDPRDGEKYYIGNFDAAGIWMLENLRYIPKDEHGYSDYMHSGEPSETAKRYAYPGADGSYDPVLAESDWDKSWGILYNWAGATNGRNTSADEGNTDYGGTYTQVRGICPVGWHLPSDMEWSDLEEVIAGPGDWDNSWRTGLGYRGTSHGKNMKSTKKVSYNTGGSSKPAAEGGFDALLMGYVYTGSRYLFGERTHFWSSSSAGTNAWSRDLYVNSGGVSRNNSSNGSIRSSLMSVRCKKD